jgi:hypothetical protein
MTISIKLHLPNHPISPWAELTDLVVPSTAPPTMHTFTPRSR